MDLSRCDMCGGDMNMCRTFHLLFCMACKSRVYVHAMVHNNNMLPLSGIAHLLLSRVLGVLRHYLGPLEVAIIYLRGQVHFLAVARISFVHDLG